MIGQSREKLKAWCDECYQIIDRLYEKKHRELEENYARKTEKQRTEIEQMQLKINKLIHEQNTTEEDIQSTINSD